MKKLHDVINHHWQKLFIFSALAFVLVTNFEPFPFSGVIKIIPIISLIAFSALQAKSVVPRLFIVGLLFSMLGDFILDLQGQGWFLYGLGAFFIAHVFYILCLSKWQFDRKAVFVVLILSVYAASMLYLLLPHLGELKIPVIAYLLILFVMCLCSIFSIRSNVWMKVGGISFLVSDSILGLNMFYAPIPLSPILIMSTYYLAQYSLVRGFSQH